LVGKGPAFDLLLKIRTISAGFRTTHFIMIIIHHHIFSIGNLVCMSDHSTGGRTFTLITGY